MRETDGQPAHAAHGEDERENGLLLARAIRQPPPNGSTQHAHDGADGKQHANLLRLPPAVLQVHGQERHDRTLRATEHEV